MINLLFYRNCSIERDCLSEAMSNTTIAAIMKCHRILFCKCIQRNCGENQCLEKRALCKTFMDNLLIKDEDCLRGDRQNVTSENILLKD